MTSSSQPNPWFSIPNNSECFCTRRSSKCPNKIVNTVMSFVARFAPIYAVTYAIQHNACNFISLRDLPRGTSSITRHRLCPCLFNASQHYSKLTICQGNLPQQRLRAHRSDLCQKFLGTIKRGLSCRDLTVKSSSFPPSAPSDCFSTSSKK